MEILIAILVIVVLFVIPNIKIVPQARSYVVERLGSYLTTWGNGLHLKIPFIDRISNKVTLKEQVKDLLDSGYNNLWVSVIYGTDSSSSMTNIALAQVGNVGGEPYWTWYGFNSRVEWCAVFVSWVANELGYIDAGIIPKFVACINGVNWFKDRGLWKEGNYIPKESDIIF